MTSPLTRRELLVRGAALGAGAVASTATESSPAAAAAQHAPSAKPFRYCLNTGTLLGFKLPLAKEVEIAAQAGYQGIEPWISAIQRHVDQGHLLADLRRRIADSGLTVDGAIGFAAWVVEDPDQRAKGLEQMKRDMDLVAQLGGRRIAAPPAGAYDTQIAPRKIGDRYRAVLELGRRTGVVPQMEIWGGSKTLGRPGEAAHAAMEAAHSDACLLLDVFHVYKGGADFGGLRLLNPAALHLFHLNDYPAQPPREKITDADRVYPGDGVAPLANILHDLRTIGFSGTLSLELFNPRYWQQDPLTVARTGLAKMRAVAAATRDSS
jgi:sugar phosphate isomerase/epimerase